MLGADLWLTGLSGAQSVGHSTNLWYPCPCWLLRKGRLTGWFTLWLADELAGWLTDLFPDCPSEPLTDPMMMEWSSFQLTDSRPTGCQMRNVERTHTSFLSWVEPCVLCAAHSPFDEETQFVNLCYIWSVGVDLTLYNSSHSLVPLCESMISWDCSVVLSRQSWNGLFLTVQLSFHTLLILRFLVINIVQFIGLKVCLIPYCHTVAAVVNHRSSKKWLRAVCSWVLVLSGVGSIVATLLHHKESCDATNIAQWSINYPHHAFGCMFMSLCS